MENEFSTGTLIFIIVAILFVGLIMLNKKDEQITNLKEEVAVQENRADSLSSALDETNSNIEETNGYIQDAKDTLGGSYDDMNNAIDGLEPVQTVEP